MTIGIAAAGTGGHVFPALAVAEALEKLGTAREDIVFFGGDRIEATAVPEAGYELVSVDVKGLVRTVSIENLGVLAGVVRSSRRIGREIAERGVTAMLAMGGYVTGPAALAARRARVPLFLHEQNAVPGRANRLAARLAQKVFVAFPAAAAALPRTEVVGNPLRAALLADPPTVDAARARYGLDPGRPVVGILGGSQGADALNHAAERLVAAEPAYQVLHLAGDRQHARWSELSAGVAGWTVVPFEHDMRFFYAAADLVVARAGALTVSELAATGTTAVLVPYPHASSHQDANAAVLADAGGSVVVPQSELEARLADEIARALEPAELTRRRAATAAVGRPDAAGRVAAALLEAAGA
jgi:UDP-N-acetylglucosamine--N-acetylmuramyl-(pentapeptide) pyrophosphoryl-undecaprenol N-acetylglucosamine transferase